MRHNFAALILLLLLLMLWFSFFKSQKEKLKSVGVVASVGKLFAQASSFFYAFQRFGTAMTCSTRRCCCCCLFVGPPETPNIYTGMDTLFRMGWWM